jgi:Alginate export
VLANPALRKDPLDALKYIELGDLASLSLGGEVRVRTERYFSPGFGSGKPSDDAYLMERGLLHADLRLGRHVRAFGQLQSSLIQGRVGGPRPFDRNELDVHQAFVELQTEVQHTTLKARLGRQEVEINASRMFSARDALNTRLTFDGARATARRGDWELVASLMRPVEIDPGIFDDGMDDSRWVFGLQLLRHNLWLRDDAAVVYYGILARKNARWDVGQADSTRHMVGTRWSARRGALDLNYELVGQSGSFGNATILAWDLATDTGYTMPVGPLQLRAGLRADITSGDSERGDDILGNFEAPFPGSAYSGLAGLIGPSNAIDLAPQTTWRWGKLAALSTGVALFWRYSDRDGIYTLFNTPQRTGALSDERFIGAQFTAIATVEATPHVQLGASYSYFATGAFLEETPPAKNTQFVTSWVTAKF